MLRHSLKTISRKIAPSGGGEKYMKRGWSFRMRWRWTLENKLLYTLDKWKYILDTKKWREFPDIFWIFKCVDYGHVHKKLVNADNATILNVTNKLVIPDIPKFVRWLACGKMIGPWQKIRIAAKSQTWQIRRKCLVRISFKVP